MNRIRNYFFEADQPLHVEDKLWITVILGISIVSVAVGVWSHF